MKCYQTKCLLPCLTWSFTINLLPDWLIFSPCTNVQLEPTTCPATLLVPSKLNNILYKSVAESCWSTSPQAENLSFAVTNIPPTFTHNSESLGSFSLNTSLLLTHTQQPLHYLCTFCGLSIIYSLHWTDWWNCSHCMKTDQCVESHRYHSLLWMTN